MFRQRTFAALSLLAAIQACSPAAMPVAPTAVTTPDAPASNAPSPEPLPAATLAGTAMLFEKPFAGATIRLNVLGDDKALAEGTVGPDGSFALATPQGLSAGAVLQVSATLDGQTLTTLYQAPASAYTVAAAPVIELTVDSTTAFALLAPRLIAGGTVGGATAQLAWTTFSSFSQSIRGLVKSTSDPAVLKAVLSAVLTEDARRALGNTASPKQREAFSEAANVLGRALSAALGSNPGKLATELGAISFGGTYVGPVSSPSGGSGGSGGSTTPVGSTASLTIQAPDGAFNAATGLTASARTAQSFTETYTVGEYPEALAVDTSGNAWVANSDVNTVTRISATGALATYTVGDYPRAIAVGTDGSAWIVYYGASEVTRLSAAGAHIATYTVGDAPSAVAVDTRGNAWVTNYGSDDVTRISATGVIATFAVGDAPRRLTVDARGNAWVVNNSSNTVTRISSTGAIATYTVGLSPVNVAVDASGNAWVVNLSGNSVTRIGVSGAITTYMVGSYPEAIAVDGGGNAWVTNSNSGNVTRIGATGAIATYTVGTSPRAIAADARGNAWVANASSGSVTRISATGGITTYPVGDFPQAITVDASGSVWVVNTSSDTVSKLYQ